MLFSHPQKREISDRKQRDDRPFYICCGFLPNSTLRILPTLTTETAFLRECSPSGCFKVARRSKTSVLNCSRTAGGMPSRGNRAASVHCASHHSCSVAY